MASTLSKIKNFFFLGNPNDFKKPGDEKNLNKHIVPVQFYRIKQDIQSWRESLTEAENPILPYRVKQQRMYADTVVNGHVSACIDKRKNLVLLKDFALFNGETIDEKSTEILKQKWFYDLMNYCLDARFYGYSLIGLGDIEGNSLKGVELIKRENISPDRLTVVPVTYSPYGVQFMNPESKDDSGNSFFDWSIYVDTNSETAQSKCGNGLLYKVAYYEIFLRNLLGNNADFVEVFGQPLKHAKTSKLEGPEYDNLEASLANMASNAYLITDPETELDFVAASSIGKSFEVYPNLEERCEKKISKILLGHSDALDSTPGKLGANTAVEDALTEIETTDVRFFEHIANNQILPKLIKLGFKIPIGFKFKFKNDKEQQEIQAKQNAKNKEVADIAKTLKDAGLKMDAKYFTERTGIPVEEIEDISPTSNANSITNSLKDLYGDA